MDEEKQKIIVEVNESLENIKIKMANMEQYLEALTKKKNIWTDSANDLHSALKGYVEVKEDYRMNLQGNIGNLKQASLEEFINAIDIRIKTLENERIPKVESKINIIKTKLEYIKNSLESIDNMTLNENFSNLTLDDLKMIKVKVSGLENEINEDIKVMLRNE